MKGARQPRPHNTPAAPALALVCHSRCTSATAHWSYVGTYGHFHDVAGLPACTSTAGPEAIPNKNQTALTQLSRSPCLLPVGLQGFGGVYKTPTLRTWAWI